MSTDALRDFLEIPYDTLEEMNLHAKQQRLDRVSPELIKEERMAYLAGEKRIKAVLSVQAFYRWIPLWPLKKN